MRRISHIIFSALCAFALSSCGRELPAGPERQIVISVRTADQTISTKAFPDSEDALRENQINSIDYFIYKNGDESAAVYSGHLTTDAIHEKDFVIDLPGTEFNALFAAGTPKMYAVVNLPSSVSIPGAVSLENLKNTVVEADFLSADSQNAFVMSGSAKVLTSGSTAICVIEVARVAAKISFDISAVTYCFENEKDSTSTKWYSHPEAITVKLMNLSSKAVLQGGSSMVSDGGIFGFDTPKLPKGQYYTYPRSWEFGDDSEPYLFVCMPVTKGSFESSERRDCYYKVIFNNRSFDSNSWYKYQIKLSIIGSFEAEVPTVSTPNDAVFFVYRWGGVYGNTGIDTDAQITGFRYLLVGEHTLTHEYSMYNENSIDIPFKSSHNCTIVNKTATSPNFNSNTIPLGTFNRSAEVNVEIVNHIIRVSHTLNNNLSTEGGGYSSLNENGYDYAPITISFTIRHNTGDSEQDALNAETVTVIQYPALYIISDENSVGGTYGGAFVNTKQESTDYGNLKGAAGSSTNSTTRMYIISTSVLSTDGILGDPRSKVVDNLSVISRNAEPIQGGVDRALTYYLPTSDNTANVIAPVFRIASSYGKTSDLSFADAKRRCATYQEDGYPMGRWRLPTAAEIQYINQLSTDKLFPKLFTSGYDYWCAQGKCNDGKITYSTTGSCAVRCVYDEWYWSHSAFPRLKPEDRNTARWGDALLQ